MRQPGQAASIVTRFAAATILGPIADAASTSIENSSASAELFVQRSLFASEPNRIASFAAGPVSDACGDVERQDTHVMVLSHAGVFAKHEAPGRRVMGTPSHAVFIAADSAYRLAFAGAIVTARSSCASTTRSFPNR